MDDAHPRVPVLLRRLHRGDARERRVARLDPLADLEGAEAVEEDVGDGEVEPGVRLLGVGELEPPVLLDLARQVAVDLRVDLIELVPVLDLLVAELRDAQHRPAVRRVLRRHRHDVGDVPLEAPADADQLLAVVIAELEQRLAVLVGHLRSGVICPGSDLSHRHASWRRVMRARPPTLPKTAAQVYRSIPRLGLADATSSKRYTHRLSAGTPLSMPQSYRSRLRRHDIVLLQLARPVFHLRVSHHA